MGKKLDEKIALLIAPEKPTDIEDAEYPWGYIEDGSNPEDSGAIPYRFSTNILLAMRLIDKVEKAEHAWKIEYFVNPISNFYCVDIWDKKHSRILGRGNAKILCKAICRAFLEWHKSRSVTNEVMEEYYPI